MKLKILNLMQTLIWTQVSSVIKIPITVLIKLPIMFVRKDAIEEVKRVTNIMVIIIIKMSLKLPSAMSIGLDQKSMRLLNLLRVKILVSLVLQKLSLNMIMLSISVIINGVVRIEIIKVVEGLVFLIDKQITILDDNVMSSKLEEFERLWLKINLNMGKIIYVAVAYFPVEGTDIKNTEALYNKLLSDVIHIQDDGDDSHILIMGDMNAPIGDKIPNGDPVHNSNGVRFLQFAEDSNLTILNCTKQCFDKITWFCGINKVPLITCYVLVILCINVKHLLVDEDRLYGLGSDHNVLLLTLSDICDDNKRNNGCNCTRKFPAA